MIGYSKIECEILETEGDFIVSLVLLTGDSVWGIDL